MSLPTRLTRTGVAAGTVLALALATGTAYAAHGGGFVLGAKNKSTKSTVLVNKKAVPLKLKAKKRKPALKVNTKARIRKLNSDLLDGLSSEAFLRSSASSQFALASGRTGVVRAFGTDDDAPGNDYAVATAVCPAGTQLTGGGGFTTYTGDWIFYSGPGELPHSWEVDSGGNGAAANGDMRLIAWAVCYNPRGPVPGAVSMTSLRDEIRGLRASR